MFQKKTVIAVLVVLLLAIVFVISWLIVKKYEKPRQENIMIISDEPFEVTPEIMESLMPPPDAVPMEITQEIIDSITPSPDAVPMEITPEIIKSITP